jgi:hypothetical protein
MAFDKENSEEKGGYFTSVDCCIWSFGSARDEAEPGMNTILLSSF